MYRVRIFTLLLSMTLTVGFAGMASAQAKKSTKGAKAAPKAAAKTTPATPVGENANALDLNSAPTEKLMTIDGVDLMTARKIVQGRPYKNKNEIVTKKIMSQEDFNKIARSVTVRPPEKSAAPEKKAAKGKKD